MNQLVLEARGYYPDRANEGFYAEYTLTGLEDLLVKSLKKENYECAARVRDGIERRK